MGMAELAPAPIQDRAPALFDAEASRIGAFADGLKVEYGMTDIQARILAIKALSAKIDLDNQEIAVKAGCSERYVYTCQRDADWVKAYETESDRIIGDSRAQIARQIKFQALSGKTEVLLAAGKSLGLLKPERFEITHALDEQTISRIGGGYDAVLHSIPAQYLEASDVVDVEADDDAGESGQVQDTAIGQADQGEA